MKEIVVISGKGGTGKTSITASFAALAGGRAVVADCDVDAADLFLVLSPVTVCRTEFRSGHTALIRPDRCTGCGRCYEVCRWNAVQKSDGAHSPNPTFVIDSIACEGCGVCVRFCTEGAIDFPENVCGEWFISRTRLGQMVHAKLGIAAENSGRLVTLVRTEAKKIAEREGAEFVLIDGSPGIGCPVIASLTASDRALIVTEPTVSGIHDLKRIGLLTRQLGIRAMVCVNKWDINPDLTHEIESYATQQGLEVVGRVRYDHAVTRAQREAKTVVEYDAEHPCGIAEDIRALWHAVSR
ncbi:MAG: 4Fe-4S binding protein [Chitinivibrionales bacterium]|nr:4Fe-4S binding protein [Chitinivibrionales bacterium]